MSASASKTKYKNFVEAKKMRKKSWTKIKINPVYDEIIHKLADKVMILSFDMGNKKWKAHWTKWRVNYNFLIVGME